MIGVVLRRRGCGGEKEDRLGAAHRPCRTLRWLQQPLGPSCRNDRSLLPSAVRNSPLPIWSNITSFNLTYTRIRTAPQPGRACKPASKPSCGSLHAPFPMLATTIMPRAGPTPLAGLRRGFVEQFIWMTGRAKGIEKTFKRLG